MNGLEVKEEEFEQLPDSEKLLVLFQNISDIRRKTIESADKVSIAYTLKSAFCKERIDTCDEKFASLNKWKWVGIGRDAIILLVFGGILRLLFF